MELKIDQLKVSRVLSIIENNTDEARKIIDKLPQRDYFVIGVTGARSRNHPNRPPCMYECS